MKGLEVKECDQHHRNDIAVNLASLPLISFVVVNFNYGRYLWQCIDSIYGQSYANFECILVDNASTDESSAIIGDIEKHYGDIRVIRNEVNVGQTRACRTAFHRSAGEYVAFIDADDYVLPEFAETHIAVHLGLPTAFAFTSSDMLQVRDGAIVLGGIFGAPGDNITRNSRAVPFRTRRRFYCDKTNRVLFSKIDVDTLSLREVFRSNIHWVWAPTTGNVYRRDAVAMIIDAEGVDVLRGAFDALLNYPLNALIGSVLIERTLSAYRIHGANMFSKHPSLNLMRAFEAQQDDGALAVLVGLDHIIANFNFFYDKAADPREFWRSLRFLRKKIASHEHQASLVDVAFRKFMHLYWRLALASAQRKSRICPEVQAAARLRSGR